MGARDDQMLDVVLFSCPHPDHAPSSAMLGAIRRKRHALHVIAAGHGDDDILVGEFPLDPTLSR